MSIHVRVKLAKRLAIDCGVKALDYWRYKVEPNLGYEQLRALRIMRDSPNKEATVIAKEADCSWSELFELCALDLVAMGRERINAKESHPTLSYKGRILLAEAELQGLL